MEQQQQQHKPLGAGFIRFKKAFFCSLSGLQAAWNNEQAFRQEILLVAGLTPIAFFLGKSGLEKGVMLSCLFLILIIEIVNSAIEAVVDRISSEHHHLSGLAKDLGSAAVALSLVNCLVVWGLIIFT